MKEAYEHKIPTDTRSMRGSIKAALVRLLEGTAWVTWMTLEALYSRQAKRQRGMALVMALVATAVLSIGVVGFMYNTGINSKVATSSEDSLKAYYMAKAA